MRMSYEVILNCRGTYGIESTGFHYCAIWFVKIYFFKLKVEELDSSFKINSKVSDLSFVMFIVLIDVLPEKDLWIST
jgi:hypothetical protein